MLPFHLLSQDDQNEMQHNCFGHVIPMAQYDNDATV